MRSFILAVHAVALTRRATLGMTAESELELQLPSLKLKEMRSADVTPIPLDEAIQKVKKLPDSIRTMVQRGKVAKKSNLRTRSVLRAAKDETDPDPDVAYPSLKKVLTVLNELTEETTTEMDLTESLCTSDVTSTKEEIELNSQARVEHATNIAAARTTISMVTTSIQEAEKSIGDLEAELHEHESQCALMIHNFEEIESVTQSDYKVALTVDSKVDCSATSTTLLQCQCPNSKPHLMLRDASGKPVAFKSKQAMKAMLVAVKRMHTKAPKAATRHGHLAIDALAKLQEENPAGWPQLKSMLLAVKQSPDVDPNATLEDAETPDEDQLSIDELMKMDASTEWMDAFSLKPGCSCGPMADASFSGDKCQVLKDAVGTMVGEIHFVLTTTQRKLEETHHECDTVRDNMNSQLSELNAALGRDQTSLAEATGELNMNDDSLRLRVDEFLDAQHRLITRVTDCNAKFQKLCEERCGLFAIRQELYKIEGGNPYIKDCKVGDWVPMECSVSCAGGVQILNRPIVQEPLYGSSCPPLQETVDCNSNPCPVDCKYGPPGPGGGDWSGWSSCSKDCGGGVSSRTRQIELEPSYGGMPCESVLEQVQCNTHACDKDCELTEWLEWLPCSKQCGTGIQTRTKSVAMEALGAGACAAPHEENMDAEGGGARIEKMQCNTNVCLPYLSCASKLDVVFLLDGSGSVGSTDFRKTQEFTRDFLHRMKLGEDAAAVSIVQFSGEGYYEGEEYIVGPKTIVAAELSTELDALTAAVDGLTFEGGYTFTDDAIQTALGELSRASRADAQQIIFVITDGKPTDFDKATFAAHDAWSKGFSPETGMGRLVFVGVGDDADYAWMESASTYPAEENVVRTKDYDELLQKLSDLIPDVCPVLECNEDVGEGILSYTGCQSKTRGGYTCQAWGVDSPHWVGSYLIEYYFPGYGTIGGHNFCRTFGWHSLWCLTTDPNKYWDYCDPRNTTEVPTDAVLADPNYQR